MVCDFEHISLHSFCNKEIECQFESVHVYIWAVLTNKQLSNGRTTGMSTGNLTGDSIYIYWTTGDNSTAQYIHIEPQTLANYHSNSLKL